MTVYFNNRESVVESHKQLFHCVLCSDSSNIASLFSSVKFAKSLSDI